MKIQDYLRGLRRSAMLMRDCAGASGQTLFLSVRWDHHAAHSGYSAMAKGLGISLGDGRIFPASFAEFCARKTELPFWERQILLRLATSVGRFRAVCILDGDFGAGIIQPRPDWLRTPVLAVFHQPPDVLPEVLSKFSRGDIDHAIVVARCQLPLVGAYFGEDRVSFVPHGVDTDYFCPTVDVERNPNLVLSVGVHRRDFDTLIEVAQALRSHRPDVQVKLIAPQKYLPPNYGQGVIDVCSGVSDEELLDAYRHAAVMLMPLKASTANNSLLEAMACGTPVVTTLIDGVADYVNPQWCISCQPGDVAAHTDAVISVLNDESLRQNMSTAAREYSRKFAWSEVRTQLTDVLPKPY